MTIIEKIEPKPGQESVWDYPRPPKLEDTDARIKIIFDNVLIADTNRAKRVLETSHPPVYYIPPQDVQMRFLLPSFGKSFCEWKGTAKYNDLVVNGRRVEKAAWYYPDPAENFLGIKDYLAFFAGPMDACYVNGEKVQPQPGGFYGGWITKDITGPFKGDNGTMFW